MPLEPNTELNEPKQRAGFVAILGAPNAGKSTLVNFLVGQKVTIVSRKVQTTRFPVRGVFIHGASQIVLVDTPGVFEPRRRLDRAMVQSAWGGAADADALVHVVDVAAQKNHADDTDRVIEGLKRANRKALLVLNKIDLLERQVLLEMAETLFATGAYTAVFMIAATRGDGVDKLADAMALAVPEGPFLYPADQVADLPTRLLAAEITREKVFERLHDE
jgi:GTPase